MVVRSLSHRNRGRLGLVLALAALSGACSSRPTGTLAGAAPLTSVSGFETDRYLGVWYEISKYPTSFEEGLVGVTAEYSLRDDGKVRVVNRGFEETFDGEKSESTAKAWAPDADHPERLKVQFFWPFKGDYWVIALDPDYEWAVVGEPKRSYLWILSRTPALPEATYAAILERVTELGYDTALLEEMPQRPGDD